MTSRLEPVETLADDGLTDGAGARGT